MLCRITVIHFCAERYAIFSSMDFGFDPSRENDHVEHL